jgi:hypothetical protein
MIPLPLPRRVYCPAAMTTAKKGPKKSAARKAAGKTAEPAKQHDLEPVFSALCGLLKPYQGELVRQTDQPTYYCLESKTPTYKNRPMYFAGVRQGKNYVSYYLMSVYACPELVKGMSAGLRKRMQGKACFNFTSVDAGMFAELARLTEAGFQKFKNLKYL